MIPSLIDCLAQSSAPPEGETHILVVARDAGTRYSIAAQLFDAGLLVTSAATFGVVELLLDADGAFDLLVIAQSSEETALFGVPQLVRSIDADLPILVLDFATADSPTIVDMVQRTLERWPLRERVCRLVH